MTDKNSTDITFVLDRSGSMSSCRTDTEGGFNTFISEQKKVPGKCTVTLVQFDNEWEYVYENIDLNSVPPLTLIPRGSTALLDTLGETIVRTGEKLAKMSEDDRPGSVIIVILTDGMENSSHEYTKDQIKLMVKRQEKDYNWLFIYIGANQDAIKVSAQMGVSGGHTVSYDTVQTQAVFTGLAANTVNYRSSVASGASGQSARTNSEWTEEQRKQAKKKK